MRNNRGNIKVIGGGEVDAPWWSRYSLKPVQDPWQKS